MVSGMAMMWRMAAPAEIPAATAGHTCMPYMHMQQPEASALICGIYPACKGINCHGYGLQATLHSRMLYSMHNMTVRMDMQQAPHWAPVGTECMKPILAMLLLDNLPVCADLGALQGSPRQGIYRHKQAQCKARHHHQAPAHTTVNNIRRKDIAQKGCHAAYAHHQLEQAATDPYLLLDAMAASASTQSTRHPGASKVCVLPTSP